MPGTSNRFRALVFDLDDTLYFERDFVASGFEAVSQWLESRLGLDGAACLAELNRLFDLGARRNTFDLWLIRHALPAGLRNEMVSIYRSHRPAISLPPIVVDGLRRRGDLRLGVVTDGAIDLQRRKVDALRLGDWIEAVVYSDQFGREHWKPSVVPFRAVLDALGTDAPRAVYVADNPLKDFKGARTIGMATIRVRDARGLYASEEPPSDDFAPDVTVASFDRVYGAMEALGPAISSRNLQ